MDNKFKNNKTNLILNQNYKVWKINLKQIKIKQN